MRIPASGHGGLARAAFLVLLAVAYVYAAPGGEASNKPELELKSAKSEPRTAPTYDVQVGLHGEIFPVFASFASLQDPKSRQWATVAVTVHNAGDKPFHNRISVQIPGWSDQEIQIVQMPPGAERTFQFAPSFLPRLYQNHEIIAATAMVTVSSLSGQELFTTTAAARLRSAEDMYWGPDFQYAQFIAAWVTPHDWRVERVLRRAKEFMPGRRLPGYEDGKSDAVQQQSTIAQARAIYRALQEQGISYVKSSITFGGNQDWSERVRPPRESLYQNSANCIDGALMYASFFENLGMEPVVVLVPGHAYVGVRMSPGSERYLYIDTAYTGRASFETASSVAERALARASRSQTIQIPIERARRAGIYPMPE